MYEDATALESMFFHKKVATARHGVAAQVDHVEAAETQVDGDVQPSRVDDDEAPVLCPGPLGAHKACLAFFPSASSLYGVSVFPHRALKRHLLVDILPGQTWSP